MQYDSKHAFYLSWIPKYHQKLEQACVTHNILICIDIYTTPHHKLISPPHQDGNKHESDLYLNYKMSS